MQESVKGRYHSIQSLGTVDGPGIRFVVFLSGCPLRCKCCHNPDTWKMDEGKEIESAEIVEKAKRYKEYFGKEGGITLSGGEPLLQPEFVKSIFSLSKKAGINTCLDTSGCLFGEKISEVLTLCDRVLLDIKYTDETLYRENVGCEMSDVIRFLSLLSEMNIPTTLRQVIIPGVNDSEENIKKLKEIGEKYPNVDKIELLPFRKICQVKYDNLKIDFPFKDIPEPDEGKMKLLNSLL